MRRSTKVLLGLTAAAAAGWLLEQLSAPPARTRSCRSCGCTDERACLGGCSWVEADLCSTCADGRPIWPRSFVDLGLQHEPPIEEGVGPPPPPAPRLQLVGSSRDGLQIEIAGYVRRQLGDDVDLRVIRAADGQDVGGVVKLEIRAGAIERSSEVALLASSVVPIEALRRRLADAVVDLVDEIHRERGDHLRRVHPDVWPGWGEGPGAP